MIETICSECIFFKEPTEEYSEAIECTAPKASVTDPIWGGKDPTQINDGHCKHFQSKELAEAARKSK